MCVYVHGGREIACNRWGRLCQKLKAFLIDAKIPHALRDRLPLVVTPTGIAWVAGIRPAVGEGNPRDASHSPPAAVSACPREGCRHGL
jgi:hypothetical protein